MNKTFLDRFQDHINKLFNGIDALMKEDSSTYARCLTCKRNVRLFEYADAKIEGEVFARVFWGICPCCGDQYMLAKKVGDEKRETNS